MTAAADTTRFNWAAVDRPRKRAEVRNLRASRSCASIGPRSIDRGNLFWDETNHQSLCKLQLGRGRSTAETSAARRWPAPSTGASIGPRSIDRGNPPRCATGARRRSSFNWAAVDRPRKPTGRLRLSRPGHRFNWAAVDRPRKRRYKPRRRYACRCFNWAAVDRPRKRCVAGQRADQPSPASIGPRSIDRGNLTVSDSNQKVFPCFNWAAVDRPRKLKSR